METQKDFLKIVNDFDLQTYGRRINLTVEDLRAKGIKISQEGLNRINETIASKNGHTTYFKDPATNTQYFLNRARFIKEETEEEIWKWVAGLERRNQKLAEID